LIDATTTVEDAALDHARRFGGVARLFGEGALDALSASHIVVVGVGGVGSWAAEALARSGVGCITLVDMDHVAESNINRQVHALDTTLGRSKIEAMAERIAGISPLCRVDRVDDFVDPANVSERVPAAADVVIDAIDAPAAKAALVATCVRRGQAVVVCGGAGGRIDALCLARGDLADTRHDPLLASLRARLRREHGFPRAGHGRFGVTALWFDSPGLAGTVPARGSGTPLACAGYGSLVTVTAPLGFAAAGVALQRALSAHRGR
jgi:tRNA A37 threonylcarbamoyladenosine dehydratase